MANVQMLRTVFNWPHFTPLHFSVRRRKWLLKWRSFSTWSKIYSTKSADAFFSSLFGFLPLQCGSSWQYTAGRFSLNAHRRLWIFFFTPSRVKSVTQKTALPILIGHWTDSSVNPITLKKQAEMQKKRLFLQAFPSYSFPPLPPSPPLYTPATQAMHGRHVGSQTQFDVSTGTWGQPEVRCKPSHSQ